MNKNTYNSSLDDDDHLGFQVGTKLRGLVEGFPSIICG